MKYIVEITTSNPSHEHVSLRKVQKKTSFVVEAANEEQALMRARGKFRSLGHYVHNVQINERVTLGANPADAVKAKEKISKELEKDSEKTEVGKAEDKKDTALARIDKDAETSEYAKQNPEYAARQKAFRDAYLRKKKAAEAGETELNVKEEYIEEKLTMKDPVSTWISDFVHSDNPKFAGKSKKERIQQALGAYYAKKREMKKEEVELEEQAAQPVPNPNAVPKKPKEPKEPGTTDYTVNPDPAVPAMHPLEAQRAKVEAEVKKRQAELAKQVKKEEVEQIDELKISQAILAAKKIVEPTVKQIEKKIVAGRVEPPIKPPSKPPIASGSADAPKPTPPDSSAMDKPVKDMSADEYKKFYSARASARRALDKVKSGGVSKKASQNPYANIEEQKTTMTHEKGEQPSGKKPEPGMETRGSDKTDSGIEKKSAVAAQKMIDAVKTRVNKVNTKPSMDVNLKDKN